MWVDRPECLIDCRSDLCIGAVDTPICPHKRYFRVVKGKTDHGIGKHVAQHRKWDAAHREWLPKRSKAMVRLMISPCVRCREEGNSVAALRKAGPTLGPADCVIL